MQAGATGCSIMHAGQQQPLQQGLGFKVQVFLLYYTTNPCSQTTLRSLCHGLHVQCR